MPALVDRRRAVPSRATRTAIAVAVLIALPAACGSSVDPASSLAELEREYVMVAAERWAPGEFCPGGGSCPGPLDSATVRLWTWLQVSAIDVIAPMHGRVGVDEVVFELGSGDRPGPRVFGQSQRGDVALAADALAAGHELWAATDCGATTVCLYIAFDERGRIAAVGGAGYEWATVPLALESAAAGAESARSFLLPALTDPATPLGHRADEVPVASGETMDDSSDVIGWTLDGHDGVPCVRVVNDPFLDPVCHVSDADAATTLTFGRTGDLRVIVGTTTAGGLVAGGVEVRPDVALLPMTVTRVGDRTYFTWVSTGGDGVSHELVVRLLGPDGRELQTEQVSTLR